MRNREIRRKSKIKNLKQTIKAVVCCKILDFNLIIKRGNTFGVVLFIIGRLYLYKNNTSLQLFLMKTLLIRICETHRIYKI